MEAKRWWHGGKVAKRQSGEEANKASNFGKILFFTFKKTKNFKILIRTSPFIICLGRHQPFEHHYHFFRSNRFPNVNWKFFTLLSTDTNSPALNLFHICNIKVVQLFTCKYRVWSNPNSGKRKIASFCWKSIYCSKQTVGCFNDNIYYSVA